MDHLPPNEAERKRRTKETASPKDLDNLLLQAHLLSDDELLLLAIRFVKETRGDAPDFMSEVAAVFDLLKAEKRR